jgi:isopentenyl phosphate kinase
MSARTGVEDADLVFVKLGGSLITDKHREATPRPEELRGLAEELAAARRAAPHLSVVLGHGSGSFGHWEANRHGTREGVSTPREWVGFARVSAAASRLNRIVVDTFLEAGVPVLSLQPSASALSDGGRITTYAVEPIRRALDVELVPLVFGDVAFDGRIGGTILSTEDIFAHLASSLRPTRVLLLGNAPGVLGRDRQVIPEITPRSFPAIEPLLRGSAGVDVTGGMADKVARMVALVSRVPGLRVWILTGRAPGNLKRALLHPEGTGGTCIHAG